MDDDDFERAVEQLYAPGAGPKPYDGARNSTHVIELQPTRSGRRSGSGGGAGAACAWRGDRGGRQEPAARDRALGAELRDHAGA